MRFENFLGKEDARGRERKTGNNNSRKDSWFRILKFNTFFSVFLLIGRFIKFRADKEYPLEVQLNAAAKDHIHSS